jgi:hypothetical protein
VIIVVSALHGTEGIRSLISPDPWLGLPALVVEFAFLLFVGVGISFPAAFAGGSLLGYKYHRDASRGKLSVESAVRYAALLGAFEGVAISLLSGAPLFWFFMHPGHGLPPPPIGFAILNVAFYAVPLILIATLASASAGKKIARRYV